jgi:hypothetical protein
MTNLGQLVRVDPRIVWKHEAHDFTPWLVENIGLLGKVLEMDLEVEEREADVGGFSLDILARDLGRDRLVVIENQLEATDHSHLGQLITYAAGFDAGAVVWVSRDFRDEHRQALDWLNRNENGGVQYFGVAVELVQIDESRPAVDFRLVASPSNWLKSSGGGTRRPPSSKGEAYREFFQQLIDELREKHQFTNAKAGQPQNWYSFQSGTSGCKYSASFARSGAVRTEVYIDFGDHDANKRAFDALFAEKEALEAEFGESLEWERLDDRRACRVAAYTPGTIEDPADQWEQFRRWAIDRLLRFKRVFGPRLPALAQLVG